MSNPFADNAGLDLSSIYASSLGGVPAITQPGGSAAGGTGTPAPGGSSSRVTDNGTDQTGTAGDPGYIDPQAPGGSFSKGSPQGQALANPSQPYIGTSTSGGIGFTPDQARQWWNQWFANPVNLSAVPPELLPGSLVLSPDEIARARQLNASGTLPPPQGVYNPLNLQIAGGQGAASYGATGGFGGYGTAQNALSSAMDAGVRGSGQPVEQTYSNTLAQVGGYSPNYYPDGSPPQGNGAGGGTAPGGSPDVAHLQSAVQSLQHYISNLQAVKNPTGAQQAELQAYQTREQGYEQRLGAASPTPSGGGVQQSAPAAQPQAPASSTQTASIGQPQQYNPAPAATAAPPITQPTPVSGPSAQPSGGGVPLGGGSTPYNQTVRVYVGGVPYNQSLDGKTMTPA